MLTATNLTTTNQTIVFQATQETAITCMIFCNYSAADTTLNVWAVPNSGGTSVGSAGNANQILTQLTISAYDTFVMDMEKLILSNYDTIVAQAGTGTSISATISTMSLT
jgi:hypothetical protein